MYLKNMIPRPAMLNNRLKLGQKRWILSGLTLVALLLSVELVWLANPSQLKIVTRFNNLLYDARFALLPPKRSIELPIVIVDLDEDSIQQEGRWPWDRAKIADLVDRKSTRLNSSH